MLTDLTLIGGPSCGSGYVWWETQYNGPWVERVIPNPIDGPIEFPIDVVDLEPTLALIAGAVELTNEQLENVTLVLYTAADLMSSCGTSTVIAAAAIYVGVDMLVDGYTIGLAVSTVTTLLLVNGFGIEVVDCVAFALEEALQEVYDISFMPNF